ncbi:SDR family NAD(P)-dependent oxidoreductase [Pseudoruegeria sp. SHC-113]|uniref:SDR family NAD(P)-dependent oxidoreductase n=1 Tax=Pseudoruegeria sp. SHC-113 TaxID=2855439 RepID=UPI0021BA51E7|nr:SDR family NAD(P)-dependent oxidoreductase [Pseudoruegeria sp. SHC-113]MCT8161039.1 SDR family NAD(P)-dependent oxidoreductase [Pseudoruegeria sp. SHC-113]
MPRALVTGGNRGIGRAIAEGLVAQGHEVVIGVRDMTGGASVAEAIGAQAVPLDLTDLQSRAAISDAGAFDILINNAGVLPEGGMLANPAGFAACMAVMVEGPFDLIRALAPGMVARGYGRIVNLSSDWGAFSQGLHGPNAYGVAKAALNALTLALSRELPAQTVKINAMCPGWVATRMGGAGAPRTPEEGAQTALWLANLATDGPPGGFFRDQKPLEW